MKLTKLQEATKEHVLRVFERQKCFLIADEVGLGKTVIAAEVIDRLAEAKAEASGKQPYIVYYICGNERVANQNCRKLREHCGEETATRDERLSMQWRYAEAYRNNRVLVLPLTPATTFTNKNSTHNEKEEANQRAFGERYPLKETEFLARRKRILTETFRSILKPDMVLLDEFQNYPDLLSGDLAHSLFGECLKQAEKVLLLSATPYEMTVSEVRNMDPFDDGLGLDRPAKDGRSADDEEPEDSEFSTRPIKGFDQMVQFIDGVNGKGDRSPDRRTARDYYETVFCRSERSMFYMTDKEDEIEYVYSDVSRELEHLKYTAELYGRLKDLGGFWEDRDRVIAGVKECPAPASFSTRYRSLKDGKNDLDFYRRLSSQDAPVSTGLFPDLDPFRHANLSLLRDQACPAGIETLLWVPPSVFFPSETDPKINPFAAHTDYTKSLVFGNYRFSTAAPACLLSQLIRTRQEDLIRSAALQQAEAPDIDDGAWWPFETKDDAYGALHGLVKTYLRKHLDLIRAVTGIREPERIQEAVDTYVQWGDLKNVLLEYAFLLGLSGASGEKAGAIRRQLAAMTEYFEDGGAPSSREKKLSPTRVICFRAGVSAGDESELRSACQMACGFAERFTDDNTDLGAHIKTHQQTLQHLFNAPFYPFVIASTSVAQEGLDFHNYCHRIVHWSVAKTPVAYEQREGRIDRYLSHLMRKRIALCLSNSSRRTFEGRLEAMVQGRDALEGILGPKPLFPYWYLGHEECFRLGMSMRTELPKFIRVICALPNSKESAYFSRLRAALKNYNYYIGPTYQGRKTTDRNFCPLCHTDPPSPAGQG